MARTVRDPKIETRSARSRLAPRREPYWSKLGAGRHVGYRRLGREGGTWIARAYDPDTRKRAFRALGTADDVLDADAIEVLTFAQAQERARAWFPSAFQPNDDTEDSLGVVTVGDAVRSYLDWLDVHRKPTTAREARIAAQAHILPTLGAVRLDRLTSRKLAMWHAAVAVAPIRVRTAKTADAASRPIDDHPDARRARKSTANRVRTILFSALNRALEERHVSSDEAWRKVKPFEGADAARVEWLPVDQAIRLLNGCSPDFRKLVRGALFTGCRYGELTALEVRDFDVAAEAVHVRESKSGKPRHVPLDAEGLQFFRAVTAGRPPRERLFLRSDGKAWGRSWQVRPIAEACAAAGMDPPVSFHVLRHTYASLRVMNGMPLPAVAATLGHTSTRMVERHYGHLAPGWVRDQVRATALGIGSGDEAGQVRTLRLARSSSSNSSARPRKVAG